MQNSNHEQSTSKTNAVDKLEGGGYKTKQSRLENLIPPPLWQIPI